MNSEISVLMSVHNGEKYLPRAVKSILNQTFTDFEFIIINDCSNDQTPHILESFGKKDARIIIFRNKKNIGLTKSLNIGLKLAKGKYIARMDADDISHPSRFAKQLDFMEKHPEIGITGTAYEVIDEKGKIIDRLSQPTEDDYIRWQTLFYNSFCHPSIIIRKSILDQNNIHYGNMRYAQDYKFTSQILKYSKGANLPEFLIQWRTSQTQISSIKSEDQQFFADKISRENLVLLMDREFLSIEEVHKLRNYYYLKSPVHEDDLPLLTKW
ncbi:MAG: glycosyltransferase, partial [Desulfobacterales bacterium]|nr:glycosyltransferase [Desulfobacterales bacterium]